MLHYNYSAPLSFLSGFGGEDSSAVSRDVEDGNSREDLSTRYMSPGGPATPGGQSSKSFTIAAILGLKNDEKPTDLTVVNLSVHQVTFLFIILLHKYNANLSEWSLLV